MEGFHGGFWLEKKRIVKNSVRQSTLTHIVIFAILKAKGAKAYDRTHTK